MFASGIVLPQESDYSIVSLTPELTQNANAVVRHDEMKIHLTSTTDMTYTVKKVVTVLNKLGNPYAPTRVYYDKSKKVKSLEATIFDAFGNEIEQIKRKEFKDTGVSDGFSLYIDSRQLSYDYTPTQYPYTIEFRYEVRTSDTAIFPPWYFLSGYATSVEKSVYDITYESEILKPQIKEYRLTGLEISKKEETGHLSYTADNIPAIKREALSPTFNKIVPKLSVRLNDFHYKGFDGNASNWKELGKWMQTNLLNGRTTLPESTRSQVRMLVRDTEDILEKAKIVYEYVQNNTRYISVQIGIGGLQPISATEVDRVKYGDCKGLSNYTKALLEEVGVVSYYTVVEAGNTKIDFEEDFPDLIQGNHAILAIPYKERYYWIDCTSQTNPFGFIGDFTDDRKVLVVTPEGGEIVKTVAYLNEDNSQETNATVSIDHEGTIEGNIEIITRGTQYDNHYNLEYESPDNITNYYKEYWVNVNNLDLKSHQFDNNKTEVIFTEKVAIEAVNYASKSGNRMMFTPNAFNKNNYVPKRYRNRKLPIQVQRGFLDRDEFIIQLPEGYKVEALPGTTEIETEFGHYKMSTEFLEKSNTIVYHRSLLIKEGEYSKDKYKDYRDFRKQVATKDNAQIVIIKKSPN